MAKSDTTRIVSKGVCSFCKGEFEKGKMTQHLKGCKERKSVLAAEETGKSRKPKKSKLFHIIVEGQYLPMYWMHLEMPASLSLFELDGFLRDIWLECCDHLSEFRIGNVSYSFMEDGGMFWPNDAPALEAEAEEEDEGDVEDEEEEDKLFASVPPEIKARIEELLQAEFPDEEEELSPLEIATRFTRIFSTLLEPGPNALPLSDEMRSELTKALGELRLQMLLATAMEGVESRMSRQRDMDTPLEEALTVGQKFTHEYDFGSTTYLKLRVVSEREGVAHKGRNAIQIIARNLQPEIPCRECGKPAVVAEPGGYFIWDSALCKQCAKKDTEWSYEDMLPIVNSPRTGVCGYTGD